MNNTSFSLQQNEIIKFSTNVFPSSKEEGIEVIQDPLCISISGKCSEEEMETIRNDITSDFMIPPHIIDEARLFHLQKKRMDAQLEVCINVVGIIFDLYGIPASVATKGSNNLVRSMTQESRDELSSITSQHFSNPSNLAQVAQGLKMISDLILKQFGDVGAVMKVAFKDTLDKFDYVIIATCISLNISLLFVTGGAELIISLTLISKTIFDISSSTMKLKKLNQEYEALLKLSDERKLFYTNCDTPS